VIVAISKRWTDENKGLSRGINMIRFMGVIYAAVTALVLALAPVPSAQAAPVMGGSGRAITDSAPALTNEVRWRGGRGFRRGGFYRGPRVYRRAYYRPVRVYRGPRYYRPAYGYGYGARCWIRPARYGWTPYGYGYIPARRVCRW
jgi:hypothetical protein